MSNQEIKQTATKWATDNHCELYALKDGNYYQWWMFGKTGTHVIANQSNFPCQRVLTHWEGFKKNQP